VRSILQALGLRLRALFRRPRVEQDLDQELEFHLEQEVEQNLAYGMTREEAWRAARLAFGPVQEAREECREARGVMALPRLGADFRYAVRALRRTPGFTIVVLLVLALGIGAATAVFSIVDGVLLAPLPYSEPDRLVRVYETAPASQGFEIRSVANPTLPQWKSRVRSLEGLAGFSGWTFDLSGNGRPEQLTGAVATTEFFRLLRVEPYLGRLFSPEEEVPGGPKVVLLSHQLWTNRYGADPSLVGRTIQLGREPFTVIGVMKPGFAYPASARLWASLAIDHEFTARQARHLSVLARLAPGASLESATADLLAAEHDLARIEPKLYHGFGVQLIPFRERMVGEVRPALVALFGAVGLLLLIACSNVANLLVTRAISRKAEVAVRLALGADRPRLIRQFLVESALLFGLASALGVCLAYWAVSALRVSGLPDLPRLDTLAVDLRVLSFAVVVATVTGLVFGLIPALEASNPRLQDTLRGARSSGSPTGLRLRGVLTVAQTAIAATLLVGAGLLARSLGRLERIDPGFETDGVLTFHIGLPPSRQDDAAAAVEFFRQVRDRLGTLPGVEGVGFASRLPLSGEDHSTTFRLEEEEDVPGNRHSVQDRAITPGYLEALGVPVRGRVFTEADRAGRERVIIVNQALARRYFPGRDPVGRRLIGAQPLLIVGVAGDTRQFSLDLAAEPEIYLPHSQSPWPWLSAVVRTSVEPRSLIPAVEQAVWSLDREMPLTEIRTAREMAAEGIARRQLMARVIGGFAVAAFLMAALGLYGVVSYQVAQRTSEIGVRMTFGAGPREIIQMVVGRGLRLAMVGIALGLGGALLLTRWLRSLLFEVTPTDPFTFSAIAVLLVAVGLAASVVPAHRATRIDPAATIRSH
jgi:predicted permease